MTDTYCPHGWLIGIGTPCVDCCRTSGKKCYCHWALTGGVYATHATSPRGQHAAEGATQAQKSSNDAFKATLLTTAEICSLPPPEWLITNYLTRDSLAMLYGPSGSYKTFLALDMALHVATGSHWNSNPVDREGRVFYVIAEGASGIGRRIKAWQQQAKVYDLARFESITWRQAAVNLRNAREVEALIEACREQQPDLIILDTFARCTVGAEENSARDMGEVIAVLDRLRRETGACVLIIHHTGKDTSNGARGSSALKGAMDTELELTSTDERITLKVTKQKDGAEPAAIRLAVRPIAESLVLLPSELVHEGDGLPPSAQTALDALHEVEVPGGVSTTVWKAATDLPERSFYRAVAKLRDVGMVTNLGTDKTPRYALAVPEDR